MKVRRHRQPAVERVIRAHCLAAREVRPQDLQRIFNLSYSRACRALVEYEALRLLGSQTAAGTRRWTTNLPVDDSRVRELRQGLGWR